jgi:hypothetical protein
MTPRKHELGDSTPQPRDALVRLREAIRAGRSDNLANIVLPQVPTRRLPPGGLN